MTAVCYHSRHSEASGVDLLRFVAGNYRLFQKIFDQIFKACIISRRETALKNRVEACPHLPEQSEIAFCTAHVPSQNHRRPINLPHESPTGFAVDDK